MKPKRPNRGVAVKMRTCGLMRQLTEQKKGVFYHVKTY